MYGVFTLLVDLIFISILKY